MERKSNIAVKVGALITVGFVLFIFIIFIIGGKQNLFTSTFRMTSVFENVSGLKEGSMVNFSGINIGTVKKIEIKSSMKLLVTMQIDTKVMPFIKKDSKASIISEGLVGNKIVEITPGSSSSVSVEEGDSISSIKPISVEDIIRSLKETGENASKFTGDIAQIIQKVNEGKGTLGQLINNESLYRDVDSTLRSFSGYSGEIEFILHSFAATVNKVSTDFDKLTGEMETITGNVADITSKINSSQSLVGTLLTDTAFANNLKTVIINANSTTKNLERGSFSFYENMEALKHNFLFKGYFEDLGYWDKEDFEKSLERKEKEFLKKSEELKVLEKKINDMQEQIKVKEEEIKNKENKK